MDTQSYPPLASYPPPPPPPAPREPEAPLTSDPWSARGALVFGIVAFAVNASFSWVLASGPLTGVFVRLARALRVLPQPLALVVYFALFTALFLVLYGLLVLVPLVRAVRKRQTPAEAFGMRRFSVPLAIGLVLASYVLGIMANGVWGVGLKAEGVNVPAQDISKMVSGFAGTSKPPGPARPGASGAAPVARSLGETLPRFLLLFVLVAVITPIAEELVYRGVVYASLRAAWGETAGVLVSALLFGLVHVDWRFAVPAVVLGILLANIFRVTRSLWPAILLHATYNGLSLILVYALALSGRSLT